MKLVEAERGQAAETVYRTAQENIGALQIEDIEA